MGTPHVDARRRLPSWVVLLLVAQVLLSLICGGAAYAGTTATAAPGIPIFLESMEGASRCTLGFAASSASGARLAVTAGHCGRPGALVFTTGQQILGQYLRAHPDDGPDHSGYALISLSRDVGMSASITATFALHGQARAAEGDNVCLFGTTSGMRCSTVQNMAGGYGSIAGQVSAAGDSGAPVVRMSDHALVGIILGHSAITQTTAFEDIDRIEELAAVDEPPITGLGPVVA